MLRRWPDILTAVIACAAILASLWMLSRSSQDIAIDAGSVGTTPVTVFRPADGPLGPVVVIAHGFAGSQRLMEAFALALARNGYVAITFDFEGHGDNVEPLAGSVTEEAGATASLVRQTLEVASDALRLGDGRLALLGHSMASDIIVRAAGELASAEATIAVSMFSREVTSTRPSNLLVIVGGLERMLKQEALRVVELAMAPGERAQPFETYGRFADGSARRAAFSPMTEHVGVLYSEHSLRESVTWLDSTFGIERSAAPRIDSRGPWIMLLIAGCVAIGRPLAALLPRASQAPAGAGLSWRRLAPLLLAATIMTPLVLRVMPTDFLPVLIADYVAVHFALYGLILIGALLIWPGRGAGLPARSISIPALVAATMAVTAYGLAAIVWPIDQFVTAFVPGLHRLDLVAAMLVGTLLFYLGHEWATRGEGAAPFGAFAGKIAFLLSLALAVALDFERLFFLVIIMPVILLFFLIQGLLSHWIYQKVQHPIPAALANAVVLAIGMAATFPMLAG